MLGSIFEFYRMFVGTLSGDGMVLQRFTRAVLPEPGRGGGVWGACIGQLGRAPSRRMVSVGLWDRWSVSPCRHLVLQ